MRKKDGVHLLGLVKAMPEIEAAFIESLYAGKGRERCMQVLAALQYHYMTAPLIRCYAAYRGMCKEKALYANIGGAILAGQHKYAAAADLFALQYRTDGASHTAMQALLCAWLAGDPERVDTACAAADPQHRTALGIEGGPPPGECDPWQAAAPLCELYRMGEDAAGARIDALAEETDGEWMLRLAQALENDQAFSGALRAAALLPLTEISVFLRGYYRYRLGRLARAEDLLLLAREMGYDSETVDALLESLREAARRERTDGGPRVGAALDALEQIKRRELTGLAPSEIQNKRLNPVEIYSMESIAWYQAGSYPEAVLCIRAGLLRYSDSFDLWYNLACVFEAQGDAAEATGAYRRAAVLCADPQLAAEAARAAESLESGRSAP